MVKQPPFRCEKTYFLRDIHIWVAANRPGWTRNNIDNTSETIWFADENQLRQRYRAHMRGARNNAQANLVGTLVVSPQLPYTVADIAFARTNKRLPQPPPAAVAPAVVAAAVAPAALPPPPPLFNTYHFGHFHSQPWYQPREPWHDEPDSEEEIAPLKKLKRPRRHPEAVDDFLENGLMRYEMDDTMWRGAKFLGAGSYGAAGLWVQVDANRNITEVREWRSIHVKDVANQTSNNSEWL